MPISRRFREVFGLGFLNPNGIMIVVRPFLATSFLKQDIIFQARVTQVLSFLLPDIIPIS